MITLHIHIQILIVHSPVKVTWNLSYTPRIQNPFFTSEEVLEGVLGTAVGKDLVNFWYLRLLVGVRLRERRQIALCGDRRTHLPI